MMTSLRLLWLVALPFEAGAAWLLLSGQGMVWIGGVGLHVLASGVFAVSLFTKEGNTRVWAWPLLGGALALLAFPVMGMLAMAAAFTLAHTTFAQRVGGKPMRPLETQQATTKDPVARAHELEVALLDELEIEPVVDVLRENDPELKRAAIEAITKQGGPGSVRLLIGLLHDPSPDARFFSSIGLSRLEDEISRAILAAQRAVSDNPTSASAQEHLAQLYVDYAVSGFMEGVSREYYLELARAAFEGVLPVTANPDDVAFRLARVHLLLGNIAEAAEILDRLARARPTDLDIHLLRMEVVYQFGDFRELTIYARRALPAVAGQAEHAEIVAWWADAGRLEAAIAGS